MGRSFSLFPTVCPSSSCLLSSLERSFLCQVFPCCFSFRCSSSFLLFFFFFFFFFFFIKLIIHIARTTSVVTSMVCDGGTENHGARIEKGTSQCIPDNVPGYPSTSSGTCRVCSCTCVRRR